VSLKATEGDNKSLLRFTFRFISPIVKISLNLDFATFPEGESEFSNILLCKVIFICR